MFGFMDDGAREMRNPADQLEIEQERASLALDAARMGEFEWEITDDRFIVSERMAAIVGVPAGSWPAKGGGIGFRGVHPDDRKALGDAVAAGLASQERFELEYKMTRPDNGQQVWLHCAAGVQRSKDGKPCRLIGVFQDISARKAEDEARNALVAELDHRVKNVLASVQSLAAQSARKTTSVEGFLKTFTGRLDAMASAHTLLMATRWKGAEIVNIAAAELGGLAPGQARWSGPEIVLNARATNSLTLALHELATNALKFGALSTDAGRVEVSWRARPEGGFVLSWIERGGPPVSPPSRRGFGSTLLERVTGRELGGEVRADFRKDGVRVTITADASALATVAEPPPNAPSAERASRPEPQIGASLGPAQAEGVRGRRILIVEDAVLLALELEAGLTEAGAKVVATAADVAEALKLSELAFDVAVLDANLNGASVTPVAKALAARGKPFIFATGYGEGASAPDGFDAPVVRKPYNVAQIAVAVAEALASSRGPAAA